MLQAHIESFHTAWVTRRPTTQTHDLRARRPFQCRRYTLLAQEGQVPAEASGSSFFPREKGGLLNYFFESCVLRCRIYR